MSLIPGSIFSGIADNHCSVPDQVNSPDNDGQKPHFHKSIDLGTVRVVGVVNHFNGGADLVITFPEVAYFIHRPGERFSRRPPHNRNTVVS